MSWARLAGPCHGSRFDFVLNEEQGSEGNTGAEMEQGAEGAGSMKNCR